MPLPPALLERLKKRKIIQEGPDTKTEQHATSGQTSGGKSTTSGYENDNRREACHGSNLDDDQEEIIAEDYDSDENEDQKDEDQPTDNDSDESSDYEDGKTAKEVADENDDDKGNTYSEDKQDSSSNNTCKPLESKRSVLGCPHKYNIYHECSKYCSDHYGDMSDTEPTMEQRKQLALILKTFPLADGWTVVFDPGVKTFYFWNIYSNQVSWLPPGLGAFASQSADQIRLSMRDYPGHSTRDIRQ